MLSTLFIATALGNVLMMETETEVEPKELLSTSSEITGAARNAVLGAHLITELSKFEEAENPKGKKTLKRLKPHAEKIADIAKKAAMASEAIATAAHTMRAIDGEAGAQRAALVSGLRGAALAYGSQNKAFPTKAVREGVTAASSLADGEVNPKVWIPASDAVYFG